MEQTVHFALTSAALFRQDGMGGHAGGSDAATDAMALVD